MEYRLANPFSSYRKSIAVVGCGGTGGHAAEGICRLLLPHPTFSLVLIDGDRVEENNLGRQNFYPEDLGRFKSQALAERLARKYSRPIGYFTTPLDDKEYPPPSYSVIVGCVDNANARQIIAGRISMPSWWIDAGNGRDFGQVLVGNVESYDRKWPFEEEKGICFALPMPTVVRPDILVPAPLEGSCAVQGPTINIFMAAIVVEVVRRLIEGTLTWWQIFLDLETGSLRTVSPTPEAVSKIVKKQIRSLVYTKERK